MDGEQHHNSAQGSWWVEFLLFFVLLPPAMVVAAALATAFLNLDYRGTEILWVLAAVLQFAIVFWLDRSMRGSAGVAAFVAALSTFGVPLLVFIFVGGYLVNV